MLNMLVQHVHVFSEHSLSSLEVGSTRSDLLITYAVSCSLALMLAPELGLRGDATGSPEKPA